MAFVYSDAFRCFEFYRLLVKERKGVEIEEHSDADTWLATVRRLQREQRSGVWQLVLPGEERESDLVLMHGLFGRGLNARHLPIHCGYVTEPGRMLDLEDAAGVRHRFFRSTRTVRASLEVSTRVIGVYRHEALAVVRTAK